jgi:hypothetical protein
MLTLVAVLCLALAILLLLFALGALLLTPLALFRPKQTCKSLGDQITYLRRCWYERPLSKPKSPHDYPLCAVA